MNRDHLAVMFRTLNPVIGEQIPLRQAPPYYLPEELSAGQLVIVTGVGPALALVKDDYGGRFEVARQCCDTPVEFLLEGEWVSEDQPEIPENLIQKLTVPASEAESAYATFSSGNAENRDQTRIALGEWVRRRAVISSTSKYKIRPAPITSTQFFGFCDESITFSSRLDEYPDRQAAIRDLRQRVEELHKSGEAVALAEPWKRRQVNQALSYFRISFRNLLNEPGSSPD